MSYESTSAFSPVKVYFNAGFHAHEGRDHSGRCLPLDCCFTWDGMPCRVPAVYICAGGIVLDVLIRIDLARIGAFAERWTNRRSADRSMTPDELLRMQADDPFCNTITSRLIANDKALIPQRRDCVFFNPCPDCLPESLPDAETVLGGYGCDLRFGWQLVRTSFRWATRRKPALRSLSLTLERSPRLLPGVHFTVQYPGQHFFFANPVTGTEHRLTILSHAREACARGECMHLTCTLTPELPTRELRICDSRGALPAPDTFGSVPLMLRTTSDQQFLHEAFSEPCTDSDDLPDWQLFFLSHNAAPISVVLTDEMQAYPPTHA